jgi:hypothetical protein
MTLSPTRDGGSGFCIFAWGIYLCGKLPVKKVVFLTTALILAAIPISAQITLTQSSYPLSVLGTDSIAHTTVTSAFPALSPMTNATWDMMIITDTSFPSFAYRVATPSTSSYEFADSNDYSFTGFP